MFIQTEATPNPATLKFIPGKPVLDGPPRDYRGIEEASESPLALRLFAVAGVNGVFLGSDFITITRAAGAPADTSGWPQLKPAILGAIMEHYQSGDPVLLEAGEGDISKAGAGEFFAPGDEPIVATIKELLESRVRPAVAQDGGDITFQGFRDGIVYLKMKGSCAGCPSSAATLKNGIENLLRHFVPEVLEVRPV